jgi:hypothetical protein
MKAEPPEQKDSTPWVLACVGVSVVVGIIVGQLFDSEHPGRLRLVSLTGHGAVADLLLIFAAVLVVLSGARMTDTVRPSRLVLLGLILLTVAFGSPFLMTRISPSTQFSIPFLPAAITEFIGAVLLGAGLRRLIWNGKNKRTIN